VLLSIEEIVLEPDVWRGGRERWTWRNGELVTCRANTFEKHAVICFIQKEWTALGMETWLGMRWSSVAD
jgi:hypothetical protein